MTSKEDIENKLLEIQEDCFDELKHIVLESEKINLASDNFSTTTNNVVPVLKEISESLPQTSHDLADVIRHHRLLPCYEEIILTITNEYYQMRRKALLQARKQRNVERLQKLSSNSNMNSHLDNQEKTNRVSIDVGTNGRTDAESVTCKVSLTSPKAISPVKAVFPSLLDKKSRSVSTGSVASSRVSRVSDNRPTTIPLEKVPDTELIDVAVGEVYSPGKLYIQMGKY